MAERLILLRHGESQASMRGVASGDPSSPIDLTPRGEEQARTAARALDKVQIDLCVTSRFPRARRTAQLALAGRQVPWLPMADLDDLRFGQFEGRPLEEYRAWARVHPMSEPIPGGESRVSLAVRYCGAVRELLARAEATVLVVAHGLPLTYLARAAEGLSPRPAMRYLDYATPCALSAAEARAAVERLEDWAAEPARP